MHTAEGPLFENAKKWRPDTHILNRLNGHKKYFLTRPWTKQNDPGWLGVLSVPYLEVLEFLKFFGRFHNGHQNASKARKSKNFRIAGIVPYLAWGFKPAHLRKSIGPYKGVSTLVCAHNDQQVDFSVKNWRSRRNSKKVSEIGLKCAHS